ncbi:MAG: hypothetical protein QXF56_04040 [Candidatus Micrarchaeia archaeon]
MLWLLFLALVFLFGFVVSQKFLKEEALFSAFPVGVILSTWMVFLISFITGFNATSILASSLLMLLCCFFLGVKKTQPEKYAVAVFFVSLAFFSLLNHLMVWNFDSKGNALSAVVVDVNYHSAIVTPMGWGDNFPPLYPYLPEKKLTYHFLFDFFSAVLMKLDSGLPMAMQIPNSLIGASFVSLLYIMMRKFKLGKKTALLAVFLILFNGNFGFIEFFKELLSMPQEEILPSLLKMGVGSTWMPDKGYVMANTITEFTLNQRVFMIGICVFALVIALLTKEDEKSFLFAAIITGLSPLFHIYSFLATVFFSLPLLVKKSWKQLVIFLFIVALLATPQLSYVSESGEGYLQFKPGWFTEPQSHWLKEKQSFLEFWLKNFSPYILLALLGMVVAPQLREMSGMAFAVFILFNLFVTQPLAQDNRKWLLFALIFFSASSAFFISYIKKKFKHGWLVAAILVLVMTLGGIQTVVGWAQNYEQVLFYKDELKVCEFIRNNTEADALILSNMHRDCVNNWGGRRVFLRVDFESLTWYMGHGINTDEFENEMKRMLAGDCELIRERGVDYILIDSRNGEFRPKQSFLNRMEKLYEESTFSFYKVNC